MNKKQRAIELQQRDVNQMNDIILRTSAGDAPNVASAKATGKLGYNLSKEVTKALKSEATKPQGGNWVNAKCVLTADGTLFTEKDLKELEKRGIKIAGQAYDSKEEAQFYLDVLRTDHLAGRIEVTFHPKFTLLEAFVNDFGIKHQALTYSGDFLVTYPDGRKILYDVKGREDQKFPIKRKLFDFFHKGEGIELVVMKRVLKFGGWIRREDYMKAKAKERRDKGSGVLPNKKSRRVMK